MLPLTCVFPVSHGATQCLSRSATEASSNGFSPELPIRHWQFTLVWPINRRPSALPNPMPRSHANCLPVGCCSIAQSNHPQTNPASVQPKQLSRSTTGRVETFDQMLVILCQEWGHGRLRLNGHVMLVQESPSLRKPGTCCWCPEVFTTGAKHIARQTHFHCVFLDQAAQLMACDGGRPRESEHLENMFCTLKSEEIWDVESLESARTKHNLPCHCSCNARLGQSQLQQWNQNLVAFLFRQCGCCQWVRQ